MTNDIAAKLAYSRKELLDLGLRNPLINFRVRANKIDVVDELPDEVISLLGAVINDTMVAYRCAMTENLKNQLPPLSRTTASD